MMRKIQHIVYVVLSVLTIGCTENAGPQREPQPSDTLYTAEAAMAIYDKDPERAIVMLDSAVLVGNVEEDLATLLKAKAYSQSTVVQRLDTAQLMLERLMESDYVNRNIDNREIVLDPLINISRMRYNNEQYLRWATEKLDLCRQRNHETEALRTEAEIGYVLTQLGEEEKGMEKISRVITALDDKRHFNEMDACVIAIKRKINVLEQYERYEEIIPLAKRIVEKMDDYRMHRDEYADNTYRMLPTDEEFVKYYEFYTAQGNAFLARTYAAMGVDSARYYLGLFEQSDFGRTFAGRKMMASTWCLLGDYGKMLDVYEEMANRLGEDTINPDYASILYGRAVAADAWGQLRLANSYWKRYSSINQMLDKQLRESQAYQYAARYHLQEERMKVEVEKRKAENSRNMAILGFLLVLVASGFIVWLLIQRRAINRKNRVLVEQIAEAMKYKNLVESSEQRERSSEMATAADSTELITPNAELTDKQLFDFISEVIRSEKLYLDPLFERQSLIDRLHISKNRIGAAFAQGSSYKSVSDYIRDLRLEHACQLLTERPNLTISEVATASGFSSPTVFGRDFKNKFEVSPSFYRQQMTVEK